MKLIAALLAALVLTATAAPIAAAATCPKTTQGTIENEVMCPRCGTPLAVVDSEPLANRERAFIRELIAQCKSEKEIKAAMVQQFGPDVIATPQHKGFDLSAYWVPIILGIAALAAIVVTAIKWRGKQRGSDEPGLMASSTKLAEGDEARLAKDLEAYDL